MSFWVYILQSEATRRYYCGSFDDIERRIAAQHPKFVERSHMNDVILEKWLAGNFPTGG